MTLRRLISEPVGFTIVELLIALAIFMLVLGGIFSMFGPSNALYASGQRKVSSQQSARLAMDMLVRQIRMAGYFPENYDTAPACGALECNNIPLPIVDPSRTAIQLATDNTLAIYGAANGCRDNAPADGICDVDQTGRSQVFFFCLNGTSLVSKTGPQTNGASYTCNVNNPDAEIIADGITSLSFVYLDANGVSMPNPANAPYQLDGQAPGGIPAFGVITQRGAVQTVVITMTAQQNVPGQPAEIYNLRSSVRVRN
jgi:type II secretory pathway component PulJ